MESGGCNHRWKMARHKGPGVLRKCSRCKIKILDLASPKGSSLDGVVKELWPKGKHRPKPKRSRKNIKRVHPQNQ